MIVLPPFFAREKDIPTRLVKAFYAGYRALRYFPVAKKRVVSRNGLGSEYLSVDPAFSHLPKAL